MGPNLSVPQGLNSTAVRSIPQGWDPQWFSRFITNYLQKADYRNATAGPGISITGTVQSGGTISCTGSFVGNSGDPTVTGTAAIAVQVSGTYGGGIQLVDGTYNWTIWDTSGTLNIGSGTSLGDSTKRVTVSPGGNVTVTGSLGINGSSPPSQPTGYGTPTGGAHQGSFAAGAITFGNLAKCVAQLIVDLKTYGLLGA